jgi:alanine racemase
MNTSWLEINISSLTQNIQTFRNITDPQTRLGVVLKGNAYGHGLTTLLPYLHESTDHFFVITLEEALQIRDFEKEAHLIPKPITVIGPWDQIEPFVEYGINITIPSLEYLDKIQTFTKNNTQSIQGYIHVDTGLGREGLLLNAHDSLKIIHFIKSQPSFKFLGWMSHFANVEDVTHQEYANFQVSRFQEILDFFKQNHPEHPPLENHIAASAATLILRKSHYSMVRIGISLFGLWPSDETRISASVIYPKVPILKPILSWKVKSFVIKDLLVGDYIGYGCTYKCQKNTRIAVLPVGYSDGYPRILSHKAYVLILGTRCPILGRIMMNHCVVDISHLPQDIPSSLEATLIGTDGSESLHAEHLAQWAQTIHYEITTRIPSFLTKKIV